MEAISHKNKILGIIIRSQDHYKKTTFFSDPLAALQVGMLSYVPGSTIRAHVHQKSRKPVKKKPLQEIEEILYMRKGESLVSFFTEKRRLICKRRLKKGDLLIFLSGAHGFTYVKRSEVLEVKKGPYSEDSKKFL